MKAMANSIRASVFFDIDETLCYHGEDPTKAVMEALERLKANGHRFFYCTARTVSTIRPCLVELEPDGVVSAAGSRVLAGNRIIYDRSISYRQIRPLVEKLLESKIPFMFETQKDSYRLNQFPLFEEGSFYLNDLREFDALGPDIAVSKMAFLTKKLFAQKEMQAQVRRLFELIVYSNGYCEAILSDVSKGLGIRMIMDFLDLPWSNSYAIGDNRHDQTMFSCVETGIAMGNGDPELKAAADYVTGTVQEDGVVQALKHFSLI